ncbi:MAG: ribonuclease Z [Chloroflexota bacterium]
MELTFLGSGSAFASEGRYWSSFIVDRKYQFDAPPTLLPQLKRLGVALEDIEVIFISHFHGDHFVGLPFLLLEYVYMTHRTKDLYIVGPPGCEAMLEDFSHRVYPNIIKEAGYRRIYIDADISAEQEVAGLKFHAFPMNHVKKDGLHAVGYRVQIGDKTVAYTGDTMFCEEVVSLGDNTDVFVVDCTYPDDCGPEHMGLSDIKVVRDRITPETTMILTHLSAKPILNGLKNTLIAEDLKTFTF